MDIGGKVIANFGQIQLYGTPPSTPWTYLSGDVHAGATHIQMSENVDWPVGATIVLATTTMNTDDDDTAVIVANNGQGLLTISPPLKHGHLGTIRTVNGYTVDTRCEVGLLTRNIQFIGALEDNRMGAIIMTSEFYQLGVLYTGQTNISNVEFIGSGQMDGVRLSCLCFFF